MSENISIRDFKESDIERLAELAAEAWPIFSSITSEDNLPKLMRAYVQLSLLGTTWAKILTDKERVIGLFFGQIKSQFGLKQKYQALKGLCGIWRDSKSGKYGNIKNRKRLVKKIVKSQIRIMKHTPSYDAIIELFIIDADYRGQGLGKKIMKEFISHAKSKNAKRVAVYTDPLSTFQFYEKFGFTRISEFHDIMNSYIMGEPTKGFIYLIDIENGTL